MKDDFKLLMLLKQKIKKEIPDAEIILFGSRARGDNDKDSDFDILILLEEKTKDKEEKIFNICFEFELENNIVITPLIHSRKEWNSFPLNVSEIEYFIEKEGIRI